MKPQSNKAESSAGARAAKVSASTVSRAFNHPDLVKPTTRKRIDAAEREARKRDFDAWAARQTRMNQAYENMEKARYEEAKRQAERRGYRDEQTARPQPGRYNVRPQYRPSNYKPTPDDRFRLIAGLLRDGVSFRRVADLADASANEVARIWLLIR